MVDLGINLRGSDSESMVSALLPSKAYEEQNTLPQRRSQTDRHYLILHKRVQKFKT